jgi:iron complex outermembrane receptor protein
VVRAPAWGGTAGFDHTFRLGGAGELTASAQAQFASSSYLSIDFLQDISQQAYVVGNFNLRYLEPHGQWSVSAYVRNVSNAAVYTQGQRYPFTTPSNPLRPEGVNWMTIEAPRTYGVRFRYDF